MKKYIVKTRLKNDSERWHDVIDFDKSQSIPTTREFISRETAEYFCKNSLNLEDDLFVVEEINDDNI